MRDSYLQYSASDFASDEAFQHWVLGKSPADNVVWNTWLETHPEIRVEVEQAKRLMATMAFKPLADIPTDSHQVWERISGSLEEEIPAMVINRSEWVQKRSGKTWFNIGLVAAACLAILLILRALGPGITTIDVPRGEHLTHTLPDASQVQLNAESHLEYASRNWKAERTMSLEGEAFFEVKKGNRFVVSTPLGEVEVLGTSFNVYNRGASFRVKCMTGKVQVREKNTGQKVVLLPGQYISWGPEAQNHLDTFDVQSEEKWWKGVYKFEDEPLSVCLEEMGRQYDVNISWDTNLDSTKWNGVFDGNDLETALYEVCWSFGLDYEIKDKEVFITTK